MQRSSRRYVYHHFYIQHGPEEANTAPSSFPTLWFHKLVWTSVGVQTKPQTERTKINGKTCIASLSHVLPTNSDVPLLFTENDTGGNANPYVKDGINNYVVYGQKEAVNPEKKGTKASFHYQLKVGASKMATVRLRLANKHASLMSQI